MQDLIEKNFIKDKGEKTLWDFFRHPFDVWSFSALMADCIRC